MAVIRETMTLEDKFTGTMTQFLQLGQRMSGQLNDIRHSMMNTETATASAAVEMQNLTGRMAQTNTTGGSLLSTVRNLAGALLGMQSARWLVNTSDQLTSINARLQLMTGSAEAAAAANEQIYQSAMRARGSYADMANFVSQLGMMAGNAFSDTGELIAFAEQIQKQIAISGASGASAQAALVQLTQGLSSGTLRGEELNSVLEQTPMIARTIAEYMGVTTGEMRELASEGKVTADVVKNAMLSAAEETNAQFEQMPMTWAQVWTMFQNVAIQALSPVLNGISWLANNIETVGPIVLSLGAAFGVFLLAANWTNICTAATTALTTAQGMLGAVMATTWGLPLIIIALVVGAIYAATAAVNQFMGTSVSATGIISGIVMTALAVVGNLFVAAFNLITDGWVLIYNLIAAAANFLGNAFNDPVGAVARLFFDLADTVLGVVQAVASALDTVFGTKLAEGVQGWRDSLGGWVDNTFGAGATVMETLDAEDLHLGRFEYGSAFQSGYDWGANLFSGSGSGAGNLFPTSTPYDEISNQLGDISSSVGSIEKSVKMSDEDLKSLVDVAERRYVNQVNLTSQTPVITINGANTGNTPADRRALADAIMAVLVEQRASGSSRATVQPAIG